MGNVIQMQKNVQYKYIKVEYYWRYYNRSVILLKGLMVMCWYWQKEGYCCECTDSCFALLL